MKKTFLILIASSVLFNSCCTIFSGTRQIVNISSTPSGAKVYTNRDIYTPIGITPLTTNIKRRTKSIEIRKDGYETSTPKLRHGINGWYWVDLGLTICSIPFLVYDIFVPFITIIDYADGACYKLSSNIIVEMKKIDASKIQEPNNDTPKSKTDRLRELKTFYDGQLITKEEYEQQRKKILSEKE